MVIIEHAPNPLLSVTEPQCLGNGCLVCLELNFYLQNLEENICSLDFANEPCGVDEQVDPAYTGRVGASEAALFLKKSGLSDIILGKHDTSSPLMATQPSTETHWAVRVEEKAKFDGIFESLLPVNGLLSGDKVKPVLMNSKLPLDVLGRVWDLSDIDKDGHLDRDEFAVAMHLVYRALEKEPVPSVLPPSLIPPSKKKKTVFAGAVPVLPASPPPKDSLRSTPSHGSVSSLNSTGSLSPKHNVKQTQPPVAWVVPVADKMRFDEIFLKTDLDLDGYVSGQEVKEIFMHSGLTQNLLAHIWALADTRQTGKLSKEQFALAMYFIQQKVSKGIDPPQVLSPDMVPPSERGTPIPDSSSALGSGEFTGVKELDDISQEIAQLQREKYSLEQDIREKEEAIRQKTSEVQISSLKTQIQSQESDLKSQEDDLNRAKSELNRLQQEETQLEQSIQAGRAQLETILKSLKSTQDEINQARSKLSQLQESRLEAHRSLDQYDQVPDGVSGTSLPDLATLSEGILLAERGGFGAMSDMPFVLLASGWPCFQLRFFLTPNDDPFKNKALLFSNNSQELHPDPFQAEDPFKSDPFKGADPFKGDPFQNDPFAEQQTAATDPFGGDPFKESDPFHSSTTDDFFKKQTKNDPFTSDPFTKNPSLPPKLDPFESSDPFSSSSISSKGSDPFGTLDPFGSGSFSSAEGFADFSQMSKFGNEEQQLAWAKRESEKAEQERLARLRRQEQEDLELAIALSKADMPA
ncbi:hypothetical protein A6R68_00829 [Neotoma lepida]|uniref:Epidermal growth factor receptor pathway substrate 15 like 1 n=1 Tax=Neotoma lepida TaxID=56216 RepID=A0A1A6GZ52_NEOLE|nr:hypothetical protein A6R68_00829 [Neotoma lepida]